MANPSVDDDIERIRAFVKLHSFVYDDPQSIVDAFERIAVSWENAQETLDAAWERCRGEDI